jgi:hypothetical protein
MHKDKCARLMQTWTQIQALLLLLWTRSGYLTFFKCYRSFTRIYGYNRKIFGENLFDEVKAWVQSEAQERWVVSTSTTCLARPEMTFILLISALQGLRLVSPFLSSLIGKWKQFYWISCSIEMAFMSHNTFKFS